MSLSLKYAVVVLTLLHPFGCSDSVPTKSHEEDTVSGPSKGACSIDDLNLRAGELLVHLRNKSYDSLEADFSISKYIAEYMLEMPPIGLGAHEILKQNTVTGHVLPNHYDGGKLVLYTEERHANLLDNTDFLQEKKFSDFVVCSFTCGTDLTWKLGAHTCFEETGAPFHQIYE